jgi:hypothetical protein
MRFNDATRHRKTDSRAGSDRLRRKERLEDPCAQFGWNARTCVFHREDGITARRPLRRNDKPPRSRQFVHRLLSVDDQVN